MFLRKSVSLFLANVAVVGCLGCGATTIVTSGPPATTEVLLDSEFELVPGQTAAFTTLGLTVRFDDVGNDSRCPVDVTCIWEGNAAVLVTLKRAGSAAYQATLNSSSEPKQVKDGNETLLLVGLLPEADTRHPIGRGEYRARFVMHSGS